MRLNFSICVIAKNEAKTLPRLVASLKEFQSRGGQICVLDTGSTDGTPDIARSLGCDVKEVGDRFLMEVSDVDAINKKFVVEGEKNIVNKGDKYFNFSAARNYAASMAMEEFVFFYDADEVSVTMDIDRISKLIEEGMTQAEYNFVYAYDQYGNEAIKFIQCKAFDIKVMQWTGIVHELVTPFVEQYPKRIFLDESIYKLGHYQNTETGRHIYLTGLAVDCFNNPESDRQSHYLAREMMWYGNVKSAIKEFERHIEMDRWPAEKAQSMIYIGDCYGHFNPVKQVEWYNKAFYHDSTRREALIKIASFYRWNKNYQAAVCYAKAALEIPYNGYYGNNLSDYREVPEEILYVSYGWMGNIDAAKKHLLRALEYQPYNPTFIRDTKFYFEYYDHDIKGWMTFPELTWLYETAKTKLKIVEIGSWQGRSTHALLSGCKKGTVYAVDTWQGSQDERDATNWMAKREDIYKVFENNTKGFTNLIPIRKTSVEGAKEFEDGTLDMVFIDAGHTKEDVLEDVTAWLPKLKPDGLICGHDYCRNTWMSVCEAIDEIFGQPDLVCDTIWQVDLSKRPKINIEKKEQIIPKKIFTAWLSETPIPEMVAKMIETQKIPGYEHHLITLENLPTDVPYINTAIKAKKWVKAVDYMKAYYLYNYGGIFMDADVEVLPGRNYDKLLSEKLFASKEENGFIGNSLIGSMKGHPLWVKYMDEVNEKFKGDDDLFFQSSMEIFTHLVYASPPGEVKICDPEYFFPYNHQSGIINVTDKTVSFHHFMKSWINTTDLLPTISIIIPQLGREEGLKKCLDSIDKSYYPKHLIETIVIEGDETVPQKMKTGVEKSKGDYIVYAANDMTFDPYCIYKAMKASEENNKALVSFNEGELLPDKGNIATHFIIRRDFLPNIGNEIFDTRLHHVGVDNLLWSRCENLGQAIRCDAAKIVHNHFSRGSAFDDVYEKGWSKVQEDRDKLKELLHENTH